MPLTDKQEQLVLKLIAAPPPGSKLAAAKEYGIDLTLLLDELRSTPAERLRRLYEWTQFVENAAAHRVQNDSQ